MRIVRFYRRSLFTRLLVLYGLIVVVAIWFELVGLIYQSNTIGFWTMILLRGIVWLGVVALWMEAFYRGLQRSKLIEMVQ